MVWHGWERDPIADRAVLGDKGYDAKANREATHRRVARAAPKLRPLVSIGCRACAPRAKRASSSMAKIV
jgi:hypothetical protein